MCFCRSRCCRRRRCLIYLFLAETRDEPILASAGEAKLSGTNEMCVNDLVPVPGRCGVHAIPAGSFWCRHEALRYSVDKALDKGVPWMIFFLQNATSRKTVSDLSA